MADGLRFAAAILAAIAIAMGLAACGGSSSDASATEGSQSFLPSNGNVKVVKFGKEASSDEREAASEVVEESAEAREAGDWAKQCSTLTPGAIKRLDKENGERSLAQGNCTKELSEQGELLPPTDPVRKNSMTGPIDALRVKGDRAYALYHGTEGKDYYVPMEKVNGEWKVDSLVTKEL